MRRTKEQAAQTRRTILEAGKTLFLQVGYEKASLDEIAANAGVKRGAVHFHFLNKAGLLAAICEEMRLPMQELSEQLETDGTLAPLEALGALVADLFCDLDRDARRRGLMRLAMAVDSARSDDDAIQLNTLAFHDRAKATLLKIFQAAERKAQLAAPWHAQSAAYALHGLLGGILFEYSRRDEGLLVTDALPVVRTLLVTFGVQRTNP
ncbi:MAG: hypothetical protein RL701_4300 [Pseudomonadota bacterium]|jgi:TetR/AcrR family acrAB operon transcriptional repressor